MIRHLMSLSQLNTPLLQSHVPGLKPIRGKVRDVYDFGDRL